MGGGKMELKKGTIECKDPSCKHIFTWVLQSFPRDKMTSSAFRVHEIYEPKENEVIVNSSNLRCYCPKCGTPHYIEINTSEHSH